MRLKLIFAAAALALAPQAVAQGIAIPVTAAPTLKGPLSGRLLIFAKRVEPGAAPTKEIDTSPFEPTETAVAGQEVNVLDEGEVAMVGAEADAFPTAFSKLPRGTYRFQAVLDRNRDYNYGGRGAGDIVSEVVEATLPGAVPQLVLTTTLPPPDIDMFIGYQPEAERAGIREALKEIAPVTLTSRKLSAFWGRPVTIQGWAALPPGHGQAKATFPVVYSTGGFGSNLLSTRGSAARMSRLMKTGALPPMIWVFLDHSSATGTHEFADSVNNGPWGEALTTEFIPWFEGRYRADAKASSRFLTGHSSGGWSTLWLQTRYPRVFGGTWSTAPDPSDFHDFTNVDIYRPNANAYVDAAGNPTPLVRDKGKVLASFRDFALLEAALGPVGGQLGSFEWVFSPKGPDGRPLPLFDRATGRVDPAVAAYWRDNYDIAHRVRRDWAQLKPDLDGKINVIVGDADTFYLDGSARRLQAVLDGLGAKSRFTYVPGGTHGSIFTRNGDRNALITDIAWEMYARARPGAQRPR